MPVCSPSLSICGIIIGVEGVIQLVFRELFYAVHSLALSEDLPGIQRSFNNPNVFFTEAKAAGYTKNAMNCWIAACLYVITLLFSTHHFYLNSRNSLSI